MTTLDEARAMDAADPLRDLRARFNLPEEMIYLDGNSLGAMPAATPERMAQIVGHEWGERLIRSWNEADWIGAPARIAARIAPLIGATAGEVTVADSTSVNIFKLVAAACALTPERGTILTEAGNFPTDLHVARGAAQALNRTLRVVETAALPEAIDEDVAVVLLTHVHYRSGYRHDMTAMTALARARGARIVWDLSHSVGALSLDLAGCDAELAVGCGYKYLNGGPGAPGFLYVAHALHDRIASPIAGWFGHAEPFAFGDDWRPAPGIARFQAGTPPMLSLLALEAGVATFDGVDMAAAWAKSCALFDLFAEQMDAICPELRLVSPRDPARRGSHISFAHPDAWSIVQAAIARGVIGDFRAPDVARFGLTPLYVGHADVWRAADILGDIMCSGAYRDPRFAVRAAVT